MMMILALGLPLLLIGLLDDGDSVTETEGTAGSDTIEGGGGDDFIRGFAGNDDLTGGDGFDTIFGQEGDDLLIGNGGNDMLCSGEGDDFVMGNGGNDLIEGQEGDDYVEGDYGNDRVFGNDGADTVLGGRGMDRVNGGADDDVIFGGILRGVPLEDGDFRALSEGASLADILADKDLTIDIREDDRMDVLRGNTGNDILFVGNGDDAAGGQGEDVFHLTLDDDNSDMAPARINDFNRDEDTINIVYDAPLSVDEITVRTDGEDAVIVVNGEPLAVVLGAAGSLSAADISVLTEDAAVGVFEPNA